MIKVEFIIDHDSREEPNEHGTTDRYFLHYTSTHEYKEITFHLVESDHDILEEPQIMEQLQDDNFQWFVYDQKNHCLKELKYPTNEMKMFHILKNCRFDLETSMDDPSFYAFVFKVDNTLQDYEKIQLSHNLFVLRFGAGEISDNLNIYKKCDTTIL